MNDTIEYNHRLIFNFMQWILFSFLLVALPSTLRIWYEATIGYNLVYSQCIQDVCLTVLAICCSFISLCIDMDKCIYFALRWVFGIVFGIVCLICLLVYLLIEVDDKAEIFFNNHIDISNQLFKISAGIVIFILLSGIVIIYRSTNKTSK